MINIKPKTKPAVSLVEVLVVLGIVSITLIGSLTLVATSYTQAKTAEIEDAVNGLMVQVLEAVKSPTNVIISNSTLTADIVDSVHYFSIVNNTPSTTSLKEQTSNLSLCKAGVPYYYSLTYNPSGGSTANTVSVCLQVIIIPKKSVEGAIYYDVTVKGMYLTNNQFKTNSLKTYRYGTFKNQ